MVAGSQPAAIPAQLDFCHPSDRNRRAGSANAQLAAGNGSRCADRLRGEPAPGRARRNSDAADHLNQASACALPSAGRATKRLARRFVRRRRRVAVRRQVRGGNLRRRRTWLAMGWRDIGALHVGCRDVGWRDIRWLYIGCRDVGWRDVRSVHIGCRDVGWRDYRWLHIGCRDVGWRDYGWHPM